MHLYTAPQGVFSSVFGSEYSATAFGAPVETHIDDAVGSAIARAFHVRLCICCLCVFM
jgi:hypothetical protein